MAYFSSAMQTGLLNSVYFAPRGKVRMVGMGRQIAQQYLSPFDCLIGVVGEAGSGKSMLLKGMFPGLELTNDDEGVNVRPLPLLCQEEGGFYSPHTFHLDVRFEMAFAQLHELAGATLGALNAERRVVVEHFDLMYPLLGRNADLLIGVGEEIIITRPNLFGPEPQDLAEIVNVSIRYRKMAHTAEDLCELAMPEENWTRASHSDVRRGFVRGFREKPGFDPKELEGRALALIDSKLPVSYVDENHITIGDTKMRCTGPRVHVPNTGEIANLRLLDDFPYDPLSGQYLLVAHVGEDMTGAQLRDQEHHLNRIWYP